MSIAEYRESIYDIDTRRPQLRHVPVPCARLGYTCQHPGSIEAPIETGMRMTRNPTWGGTLVVVVVVSDHCCFQADHDDPLTTTVYHRDSCAHVVCSRSWASRHQNRTDRSCAQSPPVSHSFCRSISLTIDRARNVDPGRASDIVTIRTFRIRSTMIWKLGCLCPRLAGG